MKRKSSISIPLILIVLFLSQCTDNEIENSWKSRYESALEESGHRNWIVVVDAAYPRQSASGITTITTGEDHLSVLEYVLDGVEKASHVRPLIMTDTELEYLDDDMVEGIEEYKAELGKLLGDQDARSMFHEDIIAKLDQASKLFSVTVLKTTMTMPYTSVFLELDCGYWSAEAEGEMRRKMIPGN